jgi:hypothetical protein
MSILLFSAALAAQPYLNDDNVSAFRTADVAGDFNQEVIARTSNGIRVYVRNGTELIDSNFTAVSGTRGFDLGDMDGDGDIDIVVTTNTEVVLLDNTNGAFTTQVLQTLTVQPQTLRVGDVDGDGDADIVYTHYSPYSCQYLDNDGGTFNQRLLTDDYISGPRDLAIEDFDGDGINEVAFNDTQRRSIRIFGWDGTAFPLEENVGTNGVTVDMEIADLDGDGLPDIVAGSNSPNVAWLSNSPTGFGSPMFLDDTRTHFQVELADLDADGLMDVVSLNGADVEWHRNLGDGSFADMQVVHTGDVSYSSLYAADLDDDGFGDFLVRRSDDRFEWLVFDASDCLVFGDTDLDGICDDVDLCAGDDTTGDDDGDGFCGDLDLCEGDDLIGDTDADGICNDVDTCPNGTLFPDTDRDGFCDNVDLCLGDNRGGDTDADGFCDSFMEASPIGRGRVELTMVNAPPGNPVAFFTAAATGPEFCSDAYPVCIDLDAPTLLGVETADNTARASLIVPMSDLSAPPELYFQAVWFAPGAGDSTPVFTP